ncbi:GDSL-type esterase/lipase family protein [Paenibacillus sp. P26]|nr:GDSL-type esterase/lipase family protein [Paenibacillus sp. P26]
MGGVTMPFKAKDKIVFIGDSITDKGRRKDPLKLGTGYVRILHDFLTAAYPALSLKIINEGISGNRVTDLEKRWMFDVLDHRPQWVSVSIGINDVWRHWIRRTWSRCTRNGSRRCTAACSRKRRSRRTAV